MDFNINLDNNNNENKKEIIDTGVIIRNYKNNTYLFTNYKHMKQLREEGKLQYCYIALTADMYVIDKETGIKKRVTLDSITECTDEWVSYTDEEIRTMLNYYDFEKTYDKDSEFNINTPEQHKAGIDDFLSFDGTKR